MIDYFISWVSFFYNIRCLMIFAVESNGFINYQLFQYSRLTWLAQTLIHCKFKYQAQPFLRLSIHFLFDFSVSLTYHSSAHNWSHEYENVQINSCIYTMYASNACSSNTTTCSCNGPSNSNLKGEFLFFSKRKT